MLTFLLMMIKTGIVLIQVYQNYQEKEYFMKDTRIDIRWINVFYDK